jgi:peptidoglycan-associated lipoprotein
MNFRKAIGLGILAVGLAFGSVGCGLFEPDEPEDYQGPDSGAASAGLNGSGAGLNGANSSLGSGEAGKWGEPGQSAAGGSDFVIPDPNFHAQPVYFAFDQARIGTSETSKLDYVASYLMQTPGTGVVVEGNCDERGSAEYNRALGERRAIRQGLPAARASIRTDQDRPLWRRKARRPRP